jgi:hypothetical protein
MNGSLGGEVELRWIVDWCIGMMDLFGLASQ